MEEERGRCQKRKAFLPKTQQNATVLLNVKTEQVTFFVKSPTLQRRNFLNGVAFSSFAKEMNLSRVWGMKDSLYLMNWFLSLSPLSEFEKFLLEIDYSFSGK